MKTKKISLMILSVLASAASAGNWHKSLAFGYGITTTSHNQQLDLMTTPAPGLTNRYINDSNAKGALLLELGLEKEVKPLTDNTHLNLGINISYMRNEAGQGVVRPLVNIASNFDALGYSYDAQSAVLTAKAKVSKDNIIKHWSGYLSLGVGLARNRLSNYQEYTPLGSTASPTLQPFGAKNITNMAFAAGIGFTQKVKSSAEIGIGYTYLDTGVGGFNKSPIQQTNQKVTSINLRSHFLTLTLLS